MPHPGFVTFLYQSNGRRSDSDFHHYHRNKCQHNDDDNSATNDTICTSGDGDYDEKLLSILLRQKSNQSTNKHGAANYDYETKYRHYLERTNDFHTFNMGMIIDDSNENNNSCNDISVSLTTPILQLTNLMDSIRLTLPLDSKRPTVNRRFYHDQENIETGHTTIVHEIEKIVYHALINASPFNEISTGIDASISTFDSTKTKQNDDIVEWFVYCNRYLRILEYDIVGEKKLGLSPHTDGIKICEQRQLKSTHTLLLYLTDCTMGGETVIMDPSTHHWSKHDQVVVPPDRIYQPGGETFRNVGQDGCPTTHVALGISPQRGRIFLFPHPWPHAGALVDGTIPKIMLRAEITIQYKCLKL